MKDKLRTLKSVIDALRLAKKYLKDPEVSKLSKFLLIFPLLYIISPVDLISDYPLLGIGWLDDTAIALTVWRYVYTNLQEYKTENNDDDDDPEQGEAEDADYTLNDDEYKVD